MPLSQMRSFLSDTATSSKSLKVLLHKPSAKFLLILSCFRKHGEKSRPSCIVQHLVRWAQTGLAASHAPVAKHRLLFPAHGGHSSSGSSLQRGVTKADIGLFSNETCSWSYAVRKHPLFAKFPARPSRYDGCVTEGLHSRLNPYPVQVTRNLLHRRRSDLVLRKPQRVMQLRADLLSM